MKFHLLLLSTFALQLIASFDVYEQFAYSVKTERAEVVSCNEKFVKLKVKYFKFNRTFTALNLSLEVLRDVGNDLVVTFQAYKFMSNEYRHFPLRFAENVCEALSANTFGKHDLFLCGNFTGCPFQKTTYHVCNWSPDYTKYPPLVPVGRYRLDMMFEYLSQIIVHYQWFGAIENFNLN